jgi:hypothetical protein
VVPMGRASDGLIILRHPDVVAAAAR